MYLGEIEDDIIEGDLTTLELFARKNEFEYMIENPFVPYNLDQEK